MRDVAPVSILTPRTPLCRHCIYYLSKAITESRCRHELAVLEPSQALVKGRLLWLYRMRCKDARSQRGFCGIAGEYFEPNRRVRFLLWIERMFRKRAGTAVMR
jgi:hypothetical protein